MCIWVFLSFISVLIRNTIVMKSWFEKIRWWSVLPFTRYVLFMHMWELIVKAFKRGSLSSGGYRWYYFLNIGRFLLLSIAKVHICVLIRAFNQVRFKNFVFETISCTLGSALKLFFCFQFFHLWYYLNFYLNYFPI